jgi:hypothetical protein
VVVVVVVVWCGECERRKREEGRGKEGKKLSVSRTTKIQKYMRV